MHPRNGSLKKGKKIDKPLARLTKGKKKRDPNITNIRNKRNLSLQNLWKLKRIVREYYDQLYGKTQINKTTGEGKEYLSRHIQ